MLTRLALRGALTARHASNATLRKFSASAEKPITAIGSDVQLKVVSRSARRQARLNAKNGADGTATAAAGKVVRTSSLPTKISMGLLAGTFTGSFVWFVAMDDEMKQKTKDTLGSTFLGDIYQYLAKQIEEICRPFTDPAKDKLLPVRFSLLCGL